MGSMLFGVSIVCDNGEISSEYHNTIIKGEEVEQFFSTTPNQYQQIYL